MDVFDAAFFKLLFDFIKKNGGPDPGLSPLAAAQITNKVLTQVIDIKFYFGFCMCSWTVPSISLYQVFIPSNF